MNYVITVTLWPLVMPFWLLWLPFSELCDWVDRRGQRRFTTSQRLPRENADAS